MEEYTKPQHKPAVHKKKNPIKGVIAAGVVVVVAALGFFGGVQYQKGKNNTATATNGQMQTFGGGGNFGGQGGMRMGQFGTVTTVSSTSISINSKRTGSVVTFAIDSSTTITKDSATVTTADIAVGDTVLVEAGGTDSTTATSITVNPSMNAPQTNSSSETDVQTN
jgi:hypothetical protein